MLVNKKSYHIREIRIADLFKFKKLFFSALDIDFDYFPQNYLKQVKKQHSIFALLKAIMNRNRLIIGAWDKQKLVGYIFGTINDDKTADIFWLFVSPDCRGEKIGRSLIDKTLIFFEKKGVTKVSLVTHRHKDYYLAQNFKIDALKPRMIGNIDMYMMSIRLNDKKRKNYQ